MNQKQTIEQIGSLIEAYFEGLYQASSKKLRPLFHPDARYVNTVKNDYMNYSVEDYLAVVDARTSPAQSRSVRDDRIISIEHDGHQMAVVKLSMSMLGRDYLDYLTLILADEKWQIISKVFSYQVKSNSIKKRD